MSVCIVCVCVCACLCECLCVFGVRLFVRCVCSLCVYACGVCVCMFSVCACGVCVRAVCVRAVCVCVLCVCACGVRVCISRSLSQGSANAAVLDVSQAGGHKKRVRRSSFLNAKKLYEDAQMARKVKQYLAHLRLDDSEDSLQALSLQCEPSVCTRESPAGSALEPHTLEPHTLEPHTLEP